MLYLGNKKGLNISVKAFKYSRWESNPHSEELDFESSASTSSATRAR